MLQVDELTDLGPTELAKVNGVVQMLSSLGTRGESVAEIAHDARNMVTALDLYCDLLREPGVLAAPFTHYSGELRLVTAACRRLVEKLTFLERARALADTDVRNDTASPEVWPVSAPKAKLQQWKDVPAEPIKNLAEDLLANRSLLAALAGPTIGLTLDVQGGAVAVHMTSEDLTRILVNLVKNSSDAMSAVGRVHISLWESRNEGDTRWMTLNVEDNGPGLPDKVIKKLVQPDDHSAGQDAFARGGWAQPSHGLGLSITRSIVEAAGGMIHAANRDPVGACLQIELPVQTA